MKKSLFPAWRLIAVLMLAASLVAAPAEPAAAASVSPEQYLNADGSLTVPADFSGTFDLAGWDVSLDPQRGPLLRPAAALLGAWSAIGGVATGMIAPVDSIAVYDGVVYVGGHFDDAGGIVNDADHLAKFENGAWSQVGSERVNARVLAVIVHQGILYIGGEFTAVGAVANTAHAAQYNIATDTWSEMDGGLNSNAGTIVASGGIIYFGGDFTDAGGDPNADRIATFSGGVWGSLGTGIPNGRVSAIAISSGTIYAGGNFTDVGGDPAADRIVKFSGGAWVSLGGLIPGLNNTVREIVVVGGVIYAAGEFNNAGGDADADYVAKFSGGAWSALSDVVLNGVVQSMVIRDGVIYVAGNFTDAGGDADADYIAKFESGTWSSLGGPDTGLSTQVFTILVDGDTLYAGGNFSDAGGDINADRVAEFGLPPVTTAAPDAPDAVSEPSDGCAVDVNGGQCKVGDVWVNVPAGALPGAFSGCRIVIEDVGAASEYGISLNERVYDVRVVCENGSVSVFTAPITVCIRPQDGVTSGKQLFHNHSGTGFNALLVSSARAGHVCGTTSQLSLFVIGGLFLPDTGFAPGVVTQLPAQPAERAYASTDLMLTIPRLGLQTAIVGVPQSADGWDVTWLGQQAGYLYGTAFPTWAGNTVITAHVWDANNNPGPFAKLADLQHGDRIEIAAFGQTYVYEVRTTDALRPGDTRRAFAHSDYDVLTLITCEGFDTRTGDYLFRRVVTAVLVEIQ